MGKLVGYLLIPLMSALLVSAQALWASFIKNDKPLHGDFLGIASRFIASPKIWLGGVMYISATLVYFVLLSKHKFFVVQIVMAALAILMAAALSYFLFHEKVTVLNMIGAVLVICGIGLVLAK